MKPNKIVKDLEFTGMYRLQWPDGVLSEDFYNLTRVKDILRNYDFYVENKNRSERMKQKASPVAINGRTAV